MEKILIIEDDKAYLENIKILLNEEKFNVISAFNGLDGIDLTRTENPDLIICDIMLPDIDGFTILKEIRKRPRTKFIPFIFLTAKAEMSDLRAGMNYGADDYLTKPFLANELLTAIRTRLNKAKSFVKENKTDDLIPGKTKYQPNDNLFLPAKDKYEILSVDNVVCIISEGVYTNVFNKDGKKTLVRKLLKDWENTLPSNMFVRIHKSYIINLKYITKIEKWFNGSLKIYLDHYGETLIASRRYAAKLKKSM